MLKNSNNSVVKTSKKKKGFERFLEEARGIASGYHIILEESKRLGFIASSVEMPNVFADGKTPDESVKAIRKALEVAVGTMLEVGQKPPVAFSHRKRDMQVNVRFTYEEKNTLLIAAKHLGFKGIADFIRSAAICQASDMSMERHHATEHIRDETETVRTSESERKILQYKKAYTGFYCRTISALDQLKKETDDMQKKAESLNKTGIFQEDVKRDLWANNVGR